MVKKGLELKENLLFVFLRRWREVMATFLVTSTVFSAIGLFTYKAFAEDAVMGTAKKVSEQEIKIRLKPIQLDLQNIDHKIRNIENQFNTVHSQQVQVINSLDFLRELLIESDEVNYQKVKKRRKLRGQEN